MRPDWLKATGDLAEQIRAFDWGSTALGPMCNWPGSLTTALNLVLESPVPMVLIWGRELVMLQNDAYDAMMRPPPEALGGSYLATWGAITDIVTPQIEDAFSGKPVRVERQGFDVYDGDGGFERRFFDYSFSPVRGEAGQVAGLIHTGFEITARERAYRALRESEARLAAAIDNVPAGVAILDTAGKLVVANEEYRRYLPTGMMPSRDPERGNRWQAWDAHGRLVAPEQYPGARALRGEKAAEGMEFLYTDDEGQTIWTSVATAPIKDKSGRVTAAASVIIDITERKRSAQALAASEKRSAFLLKLSDALRPLNDPSVIRKTACRILGEELDADWTYYLAYAADAGYGVVEQEYAAPGLPSLSGRYPFEAFRTTYEHLANGRTWVANDVQSQSQIAKHERDYYLTQQVSSWITVPLVKNGKLEAVLCVVHKTSRDWNDVEIEIIEETAERLWANIVRGRAETALRESELRLQTLVDGIPQLVWRAKAGGLWVWASPQWQEQTGLTIEESLGLGWLDAIYSADRDKVSGCWQEADRTGQLQIEARICTTSTDDWRWFQIRATPVRNKAGKIVEWLGTATDIHDLRELQDRQSVLVAELQHRTRNLINVVKAISRRTLKKSRSLDDFEHRFGERLAALSRVQGLLSNLAAGQRVTFDALLTSELLAMAAAEDRIVLDGAGDIELRSATVQTMALALHELATNATKYGALGVEGGHLTVRWTIITDIDERRLLVDWRETGVSIDQHSVEAESSGYGRELIEHALPYQLGAKTTFRFGSDGVHCMIEVPLAQQKA